ncbi:DUF3391 domain-containing protein [soil metagenome]
MNSPDSNKKQFIAPSQLCIGLYVHLDLGWTEHPFTFSSFRIKSLDQIETIQALGLERIHYSPDRSEAEPLAATTEPAPAPMPALPREEDPAYQAKRERLQRLVAYREKVTACERELMSNARSLKAINQNLFSRPLDARLEVEKMVNAIADSMLSEPDVSIHLMPDKIGGEDAYHHALNVTVMSMILAKELKAPPAAVYAIGQGAVLHDVGKHDIPLGLQRKTTPLTRPELGLVQQHCLAGVQIGQRMGLPPEVSIVIEQHHEHVDGSGYPKKLAGPQLNLLAKIVALVNAYDNLCNPVNPAAALTPHEALSTLYGQRRALYDPAVMAILVRTMGIYPPGTVVVLSNGAIGLVTSINSSRPLRPTILVYDPEIPKEAAILVDLDQEPDITIVKTLRPQQLPQAVHDYLAPRKRMTYHFNPEAGKVGA